MRPRFDIVGRRGWFFSLSLAITIAGLIPLLALGFNLGTDFKAGSQIQLAVNQPFDTRTVAQVMAKAGVQVPAGSVSVAGLNDATAMIRFPEVLSLSLQASITKETKVAFPNSSFQINTVDPFVAQQTSRIAVWAVLMASLFIAIYVLVRFEYRFSAAALVALLHDVFIVMSAFALLRLEVNLSFVAAVLTIVGYSINDTIVIFDRIRENLKLEPPKSYPELSALVNKSLWQTMTRSLNTVATVLLAALMLFFFGGQSIHDFTFGLTVGLISGAYSSIFIASPLWVLWYGRKFREKSPIGTGIGTGKGKGMDLF